MFLTLNLLLWGCGGSRGGDPICQGPGATVSGKATFENRQASLPSGQFAGGFTGIRDFRPIQFADVEVIRNSDGAVIAAGATDANGFFCVDFGAPQADVYVSVSAKTNNPNYNLEVRRFSDSKIYAIRSNLFNDQSQNRFNEDLPARVSTGAAGAFKILDTFEKGVDFAREQTGTVPPLLTAFWTMDFDTGTGFGRSGLSNLIGIDGGGTDNDSDEYDEGVLLHEFGHFLANVFSRDSSLGLSHTGTDNSQDIRLSWSEGWANFISGAIRGDRYISDFCAADPPGNCSFSIDLEDTPDFLKDFEVFSTNELAVAKTLWDIYDTNNDSEDMDELGTGIGPIWDVFRNYLTLPGVTNISMEDFWDGWFIRGHNLLNEMEKLTKRYKMEFFEDQFETLVGGDNNPNSNRSAALGGIELHTIFPEGDVDYIAFNATTMNQQFTIQTLNLSNGADTFLEIVDENGQVVGGSNDDKDYPDPNSKAFRDGCNTWRCVENCDDDDPLTDPLYVTTKLPACPNGKPPWQLVSSLPSDLDNPFPSRISFTAPSIGTFYAKVSRSPRALPSTGRYGSYGFQITSP